MKSQLILRTEQAAEVLNVKRSTLEMWRCRGIGPAYVKLPAPRGQCGIIGTILSSSLPRIVTYPLCAQTWSSHVIVKRGKYFHFAFMLDGERYRGSTKETTASKARQFESMLIADIRSRGGNRKLKRSPILSEFATLFLAYIDKRTEAKPNGPRH